MSEQETLRYSDGRPMPILVGEPITDVHREIVRKYLGPPGPGEVLTAAMVNRAITLDREGAVPYDQLGAEFPPASVLDPEPAERLQDTVRDVRDRRAAGITIPVRVDIEPKALRITALQAAAQVYTGKAGSYGTDTVLEAAEDFAAWLATGERPDRFPPEAAPPDPGMGIRR